MKDIKRYSDLRKFIEKKAFKHLKNEAKSKYSLTESVMIGLDFISCPYASQKTKDKILRDVFDISDPARRANVISMKQRDGSPQLWFTTWTNFNFGEELDAKQSLEVY